MKLCIIILNYYHSQRRRKMYQFFASFLLAVSDIVYCIYNGAIITKWCNYAIMLYNNINRLNITKFYTHELYMNYTFEFMICDSLHCVAIAAFWYCAGIEFNDIYIYMFTNIKIVQLLKKLDDGKLNEVILFTLLFFKLWLKYENMVIKYL